MRDDATIYLMYHELELAGRPLCRSEQGYARYAVHESSFREQMQWLQSSGIRGVSVTEALNKASTASIAITFDDGCETDLTVAAPILRDAKFGATFYITLGFLGRPGYMVERQVRELSDAGFEIGCHSITHPYLPELAEPELHREIVEAKHRLEAIIGRPVLHFSCPGGGWSARAAQIAKQAGYESVTTSRVRVNRRNSDRFELARIPVMRDLPLTAFQDLCRGRGLWQRQIRTVLQSTAHHLLGNQLYDRLRGLILERRA